MSINLWVIKKKIQIQLLTWEYINIGRDKTRHSKLHLGLPETVITHFSPFPTFHTSIHWKNNKTDCTIMTITVSCSPNTVYSGKMSTLFKQHLVLIIKLNKGACLPCLTIVTVLQHFSVFMTWNIVYTKDTLIRK